MLNELTDCLKVINPAERLVMISSDLKTYRSL
jgi:hypothetical protein